MATVVQQHERECAVCTNDFNTPKILPCGHLLCLECVISWIKSKSDAGCPLCTCPIVEHQSNSSQSAADVSSALPTDSVMEAIVESAGMLVKDNMCTICDDVTAEYICMQCFEKMCPSCMKIHKKMSISRSHDVESVSTVTPERLAASRPALCAEHGDKQAEFFCTDHRLVICGTCFSNKHNKCSSVKHLDNEMQSAEKSLDSLKEKLAEGKDNLKQAIVKLNVRMQQADVTEQENMALVDKTCDSLQKMVDECREQLKQLISDSFSKFKKSLYDVKIKLDKRLGKVTSHKHLVTRATTVRPRPALIHAAQTLTDRVNSLDLSNELEAEPWVNPSSEITKYCDDVVKEISDELKSINREIVLAESQKPVLVFHENCATSILVTNFRKTARMVEPDKDNESVVVSRDAMAVNVLYEVRIDEIKGHYANNLRFGGTSVPPSQLTLPTWSDNLRDFVILWQNGIDDNDIFVRPPLSDQDILVCGKNARVCGWSMTDAQAKELPTARTRTTIETNVTNALKYLKVGSRVGLLVDSSNNLHFYADGVDQGVAVKDVPRPCFAFFDLSFNVIHV